jgi:hypothetical protein
MNTVWTPEHTQKPDQATAATLLLSAYKESQAVTERLASAYKTLTGKWPDIHSPDEEKMNNVL